MIPTYDQFIEPLLRYLAQHPQGVVTREIQEALADRMGLTDEQRATQLPSGAQVYKNRIGWAHDRLKRADLSVSPKRGFWQLTPLGVAFAAANPGPLAGDKLDQLTAVVPQHRLRPATEDAALAAPVVAPPQPETESPDDRLVRALDEISDAVATELLEVIGQSSPQFFEILVLDLLHAMGYGGQFGEGRVTNYSHDGGIDGVINEDKLGLDVVCIQAKRWQGTVSRPTVQSFVGSMDMIRAKKGVVIATSNFSRDAVEFVDRIEGKRVVLINGKNLAQLMIDHDVGVSTTGTYKLKEVSNDFFEEEST
mgnify:CR=1 FL=1